LSRSLQQTVDSAAFTLTTKQRAGKPIGLGRWHPQILDSNRPVEVSVGFWRVSTKATRQCQTGWLKASLVVDTSALTDATPDAVVPAFDCASKAADAVTIHRTGTGRYTLILAGLNSGVGISSSANVGGGAANVVTAASTVDAQSKLNLTVWNNGDAALVDGKTVSLLVF
jgi:hypothetical protein